MDLNQNIPLVGINKRRTHPPKYLTYTIDDVANGAFALAGRLIKYVNENWDELNIAQKISAVSTVTPIAMKRIPDRVELLSLTLNATDAELSKLMTLASVNIDARQSSLITHEVKPAALTQPIDSKQLTTHEIKSENKPNVL